MNKTKKIMSALFAAALVIIPVVSFAATLNNDPQDYATLRVANNSTNPSGSTSAWVTSASASAGDTVSFAIYYHNTGPDSANNLRVKLSPQTTGTGSTQAFSATVSSDNSNSVYGSATVYLSSPQVLSYIPGSVSWYPYNSNPTTKASLPNGQTGSELFNNGLNLGTITYDAQNPWATQGSVTVSFSVSPAQQNSSLPTVITNSATNISQSSATINGTVNPNGSDANTWFEWGTSTNLGTTIPMGSKGSGTNTVAVNAGIWNLAPNTTYYYRLSASSAQGTIAGSILSFTTTGNGNSSAGVPTITTNSATNISQNNATLNGYVDPNGTSDTVRWFEWGTYYSSLNNATTHYNQGSSAGSFSEYLSGLSQYNTYYYHAVAQNSQGVVYGATLSFTVNGGYNQSQVTVTTQSPTNIAGNSATLNGYVDPSGTSDTVRWFEWGTYYSSLNNATTHYNQGSSAGSFSEYISNLSQNTTYYYHAVAQNAQGIVYGTTLSFTVGSSCNNGGWYNNCGNGNNVAVVNTRNADTSDTYAVLNGYVDPNGTTDTVRWFEWGTAASLGQTTQYLSQGNYASSFSSTLTGIYPNTTYYYRAVARNSMGTVYGSILSFTTINSQTNYTNNTTTGTSPTVTTLLATEISSSAAKMNGLVFSSGGQASNAWFEWGTDTNMSNKTPTYAVGTLPVVRYADVATGLVSGQTYYYRIVAENIYGRVYGSTLSFVAGNPTTTTTINTPVVVSTPTRTVTVVTQGSGVESLVALNIDGGDETITPGEKRAYHVTWENKSSQTLQNVVLRVVFPQSMNVESATRGSFSQIDNAVVVDIKTLAPQEKGETFIFTNADASLTSGQLLVVTANMVYTKANGVQGDAIAYVTHRVASYSATNGFAASLFGAGSFLPTTLFGWLLLFILVLALVLLGNYVYGRLGNTK